MSRIILTTIALFLFLSACSMFGNAENNPENTIISSSTANDPDGDGDSKGADYFPATRPAIGKKVFVFDPNYHAWAVYDENGKLINTGKASGGKLYCPDVRRRCTTISGNFKIISKQGADCKSSKYPLETNGGAPMPYCMYFSSKGYGIHGSYDIPDDNASHGCIRITPTAAKWLNENFLDVGSNVIVLGYNN